MKNEGKLFSPGKLLLTSEYLVLDGALALALGTRLGQELFFDEVEDGRSEIHWEAYDLDHLWMKTKINYQNWKTSDRSNLAAIDLLIRLLQHIRTTSCSKLQGTTSYHLRTHLQFPAYFGLGSSSTLVNNLAKWAEIDPFPLNEISFGGSSYDIAVAKEQSSVLYQNRPQRHYTKLYYQPPFKEQLLFIHLNQKQNSREGIHLYRSREKSQELVNAFSQLTQSVLECQSLDLFQELMNFSEAQLSSFLRIPTVKERYFQDCPVFVKSLGAWGGDFVLTTKFEHYKDYFSNKGYTSIFEWDDLIKD